MVKIWHLCEKNKNKVNERSLKSRFCDGMEILQLDITNGGDASENSKKIGTRMLNQ
jgi:hypothetical protein